MQILQPLKCKCGHEREFHTWYSAECCFCKCERFDPKVYTKPKREAGQHMYRLTKLSDKWFAKEIISIKADIGNIEVFVSEGTPVLIADTVEDASETLGLKEDQIEIVD